MPLVIVTPPPGDNLSGNLDFVRLCQVCVSPRNAPESLTKHQVRLLKNCETLLIMIIIIIVMILIKHVDLYIEACNIDVSIWKRKP